MKRFFVIIILVLALSITLPAAASTITGATYQGTITITNNSSATTSVVVPVSLNSTALITQGLVNSSLTNTAIRNGSTDVAYMPQPGSNNWWLFVPTIGTSQTIGNTLYTGGTDMGSKLRYFPGTTGMIVADNNTSLEPSDNFSIQAKGFFNLSSGSATYIVYHSPVGMEFYRSASGQLTATISSGSPTTVTASSIADGEHTIILTANGSYLLLYVDGVLSDNKTLNGAVPNIASNWQLCYGSVMPYVEYFKFYIGGNLKGYWSYAYNAKFYDQSGNGNTATPSFPTASSDADVSATLTTFSPKNPATISSYSLSVTGNILSADPTAPSQMYTEGDFSHLMGADFINALLDAGETPRALWWYPFLFIGLALLFILLAGPAKSVLLPSIVIEALLAGLGIMGVIPLLAAFLWPIWASGWVVNEKHLAVG